MTREDLTQTIFAELVAVCGDDSTGASIVSERATAAILEVLEGFAIVEGQPRRLASVQFQVFGEDAPCDIPLFTLAND